MGCAVDFLKCSHDVVVFTLRASSAQAQTPCEMSEPCVNHGPSFSVLAVNDSIHVNVSGNNSSSLVPYSSSCAEEITGDWAARILHHQKITTRHSMS